MAVTSSSMLVESLLKSPPLSFSSSLLDRKRVFLNGEGGLSMTRALGNEFYKVNGKDLIPAEPDITVRKIDQKLDQFLLVVSDGLLEGYEPQDLVNQVCRVREEDPQCSQTEVMKKLCHASLRVSQDNLTSIMVSLNKEW